MHAAALVIVPREWADRDLVGAVHALMVPYDENEFVNGWWDWWRIGGRWDGDILGLEPIDTTDAIHYSDAVEKSERNSVDVMHAAEYATYTVVSPAGFSHRQIPNPSWDRASNDYSDYMIDNPEYHAWRAHQLLAHRNGVAVVVDYHY